MISNINDEQDLKYVLNQILDGNFDNWPNEIDKALSIAESWLKTNQLFEEYDNDQNSLLHKATDHYTEIISIEASKYL